MNLSVKLLTGTYIKTQLLLVTKQGVAVYFYSWFKNKNKRKKSQHFFILNKDTEYTNLETLSIEEIRFILFFHFKLARFLHTSLYPLKVQS